MASRTAARNEIVLGNYAAVNRAWYNRPVAARNCRRDNFSCRLGTDHGRYAGVAGRCGWLARNAASVWQSAQRTRASAARCQKCGEIFRIAPPSTAEPTAPLPRRTTTEQPPPAPDFDDRPALVSFGASCVRRTDRVNGQRGPKDEVPGLRAGERHSPAAGEKEAEYSGGHVGRAVRFVGHRQSAEFRQTNGRGARRHAVHCIRCGTLMYARDEHIGKKLKCRRLRPLTTAKASAPTKPKPVLVEPGEEYDVEEPPPLAETLAGRSCSRQRRRRVCATRASSPRSP